MFFNCVFCLLFFSLNVSHNARFFVILCSCDIKYLKHASLMGASPLSNCEHTRGGSALEPYDRSRYASGRSRGTQKTASKSKAGLFFKNLCNSIDETRLRKHFEVFGKITNTNIKEGSDMIFYTTLEDVEAAVIGMNGRILGSKPMFAQMGSTDRKSCLDRHHAAQNASVRQHKPTCHVVCFAHH